MALRPVIPPEDTPIEQHYSIPKAAKLSGFSESTLRRACRNGEIRWVNAAGANSVQAAPRIPATALAKFIEARTMGQAAS